MNYKRYIACCTLTAFLSGCSVLDSVIPAKSTTTTQTPSSAVLEEHEGKMPDGSSLPVYPDQLKNKLDVCVTDMQDKAQNAFITLTGAALDRNVILPSSAVYIAPYVIDEKYNDCVKSATADLYGLLADRGYAPVRGNIVISQNAGSRILIPSLIRHCRSQNIPYAILGIIEDLNKNPSASLQVIDVKSGAILFNQHKKLN